MGLRRFEGRYRKAEDVEAASPSKAFLYLHKGDLEPISEVRRSESYHYTWSRIDDATRRKAMTTAAAGTAVSRKFFR